MGFLDKNLSSGQIGITHWPLEALEAIAMHWHPCHTWEITWSQSPVSCWILVKNFPWSHPGWTWGQGANFILQNVLDWREYAEQSVCFVLFFPKGCIRLEKKSWHLLSQWLDTPILKSKKAKRAVRGESPSTGRKGSQRHSGTVPSPTCSIGWVWTFVTSFTLSCSEIGPGGGGCISFSVNVLKGA